MAKREASVVEQIYYDELHIKQEPTDLIPVCVKIQNSFISSRVKDLFNKLQRYNDFVTQEDIRRKEKQLEEKLQEVTTLLSEKEIEQIELSIIPKAEQESFVERLERHYQNPDVKNQEAQSFVRKMEEEKLRWEREKEEKAAKRQE